MKRPLVIWALALAWGIILADLSLSDAWGIAFAALSILAFILFYLPIKGKASPFILLAVPFLIAGYTLHSINENYYKNLFAPWNNQTVVLEGRVLDMPRVQDGKVRFTLEANTLKSQDGQVEKLNKARVQITVYSSISRLEYGSMVRITGRIRLPQSKRNIGGFDTQKYLAARKVAATMAVSSKSLTIHDGKKAYWFKETGYKIRGALLKGLNKYIPGTEASVLAGMIIGYTDEMPQEMEEGFRRAGLSHIMAVSGANIAFIVLPIMWILLRMGLNKRWASMVAFPAMLLYVFATGMEASIVRAAIMAGIMLIGMMLWRKTDIYCSLAASALIILLYNSYMLFDLGFILSFSATLSLAVFYKPIFSRISDKLPKSIRDALAGTLAAQIGVMPVIVYNFNTLSFVSFLSNILVIPLTGTLTLLGILSAGAGYFALGIGKILGFITRVMTDILIILTQGLSKFPWAEILIATPPLLLIVMYYLFLFYIRFVHPKLAELDKAVCRQVLAGIVLVLGVVIIFICVPDRNLKVYFADVGQGDCTLIRTPKGSSIIIDGGGSSNDKEGSSYIGEKVVVPLLYDLNMTQIDLMIATHGHMDHIGGLLSVIEKMPVKKLAIADSGDDEIKELVELAQEKNIQIVRANEGDVLLSEEGLTIKALYPLEESWLMPDAESVSVNELGLVTRLDYGGFSALFTGDIGTDTEELLIRDGALIDCDLLKVAHHGSKYSTGRMFLKNANPSLAVISVGANNYGHPSPEVIDRLKIQGTRVLNTLDKGGILVEAQKNGNRMRVSTVIYGK